MSHLAEVYASKLRDDESLKRNHEDFEATYGIDFDSAVRACVMGLFTPQTDRDITNKENNK